VRQKQREDGGFFSHFEKRFEIGGERIQELRIIEQKLHDSYVQENQDMNRKVVEIIRTCFNYKTQYFVLETLKSMPGRPTTLRTASHRDQVELPPFLKTVKEITGDKDYSNYNLSRIL